MGLFDPPDWNHDGVIDDKDRAISRRMLMNSIYMQQQQQREDEKLELFESIADDICEKVQREGLTEVDSYMFDEAAARYGHYRKQYTWGEMQVFNQILRDKLTEKGYNIED